MEELAGQDSSHPNIYSESGSEKHFVQDSNGIWTEVALPRPLHIRQPGRPWLAYAIDRLADRAAFIWYSGNTVANSIGSLMLYLSNADGYCWYASLKKADFWDISDEFLITRRELLSFAAHGTESTEQSQTHEQR
jgi:hypothetical protein